jgi:hypothetical protein
MTTDQLKAIGYENKINQLESENAQLKQLLEDFVKSANTQSREIDRLHLIIERAKDYCKRMIEWANYKTVIEILEGAEK